jgi:hypothetical protein
MKSLPLEEALTMVGIVVFCEFSHSRQNPNSG